MWNDPPVPEDEATCALFYSISSTQVGNNIYYYINNMFIVGIPPCTCGIFPKVELLLYNYAFDDSLFSSLILFRQERSMFTATFLFFSPPDELTIPSISSILT